MNKPTEILISQIRVPAYQRELNQNYVKSIVKNWDDILMNPIRVNLRKDGFYYIIDGQHTFAAFTTVYPEAIRIPGYVYENLTYENEAKMFVALNDGHKKPTFNEQLWAKIQYGDALASKYYQMLKESGIKFSFGTGDGKGMYGIIAHGAVISLYKKYGENILKDSLSLIESSTLADSEKYRNYCLKAVISFMGETSLKNVKVDRAILIKTINSLNISKDILAVVSTIKPAAGKANNMPGERYSNIYGLAFCMTYNKHIRSANKKINASIFLGESA